MNGLFKTAILWALFTPTLSIAAQCNGSDNAKDYWQAKIGVASTRAATVLLDAQKNQQLTPGQVVTLQTWLDSVYESAREIDATFGIPADISAVRLVDGLKKDLTVDETWQVHDVSLPQIVLDIPDEIDGNDHLTLHAVKSRRVKVEIDTYSTAQKAQCQQIIGCTVTAENACQQYAAAWAKVVTAYKHEAYKLAPEKMAARAIEYEKDWNNYFDEARSQTLLDRLLTAALYNDELRDEQFQKAPDLQYFFAHPGVVMEYVDGAQDGEQLQAALSVEWIGVNNWRECNLGFAKIPVACGVSLVSLYSDRASTEDTSHGLMFHLDNSYSFGLVDRDGNTGIFITVDLLKAYENKREEIGKWKEIADETFRRE